MRVLKGVCTCVSDFVGRHEYIFSFSVSSVVGFTLSLSLSSYSQNTVIKLHRYQRYILLYIFLYIVYFLYNVLNSICVQIHKHEDGTINKDHVYMYI